MTRRSPSGLTGLVLACVGSVLLTACSGTLVADPASQTQIAVPPPVTSTSPTNTPFETLSPVTPLATALATPTVSAKPSVKPSATTKPTAARTTSSKKPTTKKPTTSAPAPVTGVRLDPRCTSVSKAICADKSKGKLYWVVNGQIVKTFAARFGRPEFPSSEGQFAVYSKNPLATSTKYGDTPMPWAMFYNGNEGVHYSAEFAANTNPRGSHGCINLKDKAGAQWLFGQVSIGTRVVVYRSARLTAAAIAPVVTTTPTATQAPATATQAPATATKAPTAATPPATATAAATTAGTEGN